MCAFGSTIHVPKDGNCAIYVPSKVYVTLNACHFTDLKTTLHIGFIVFWDKKIWAEALIELQLRQLLVIIPPQCVKKDWRSQWRSTKNQPKPTLQKCSPEISKKGGRFFF